MRGFVEIRNQYNLDKDKIERARGNSNTESLAEEILSGFTRKGIMKLARKNPGWENREVGIGPFGFWGGPVAWCVAPINLNKNDNRTDFWIRKMMQLYEEKCNSLWHALTQN